MGTVLVKLITWCSNWLLPRPRSAVDTRRRSVRRRQICRMDREKPLATVCRAADCPCAVDLQQYLGANGRKPRAWEIYHCNPLDVIIFPEPRWSKVLTKVFLKCRFSSEGQANGAGKPGASCTLWDVPGGSRDPDEDSVFDDGDRCLRRLSLVNHVASSDEASVDDVMLGLNMQVALGEALEVRGNPLSENEIWGVLCQAAGAVQDIFLNGDAAGEQGPRYAICPDTLMLGRDGKVTFNRSSFQSLPDKNFVPPEYFDLPEGRGSSDAILEKMYVFALGMTMYTAADFKLAKDQELEISDSLDSLLSAMCDEDAALRVALLHVMEACAQFQRCHPNRLSNSAYVSQLYNLVLGSDNDLQTLLKAEDRESRDPGRRSTKRAARAHLYHNHSRSRSRSKSRSRSRSRSREELSYHSNRRERPLPVGRDKPAEFRDGYIRGPDNHGAYRDPYILSGQHTYPGRYPQGDPASPYGPAQPYYTLGHAYPDGGRRYPHDVQTAHHYPQHGAPYPLSSLSSGAVGAGGRRGYPQDGGVGVGPGVAPRGEADSVLGGTQEAYQRLRDRQRKLQALRHGLVLDEADLSDLASMPSESADLGERKSMISTQSLQHGVYRPDMLHGGSQMALSSGGRYDVDMEGLSVLGNETEWLRRQQEEIKTLQRAQARLMEPRAMGDGARSEAGASGPATPALATAAHSPPQAHLHSPPHAQAQAQAHSPPHVQVQTSTAVQAPARGATPSGGGHASRAAQREPRPASGPSSRSASRPASQPASRPLSRGGRSASPRPHPSTGQPAPAQRAPRQQYGPEFVYNESVVSVQLPEARTASAGNVRHVKVVLLNGQKLDVVCEPNSTGKHLMDGVVFHLSLAEHYLFGLTVVYEGEHFFLDPDSPLHKMAPKHWKDPAKGQGPAPFTTYFRVKFYVEAWYSLRFPLTKHLFYLQLRRDLLEERCQCDEEQTLHLASLAVQAEYGDWYDKSKDLSPEHYLAARVVRRLGKVYVKDHLPPLHRRHRGMTDRNAEAQFVKEVMELAEYGIHFYRIYKSKKDHNQTVWTGISVRGILVAQPQGDIRVVSQRHSWHLTEKISFNRRRFSILPRAEASLLKQAKLNLYTDSYKKSRYLTHLCTAHHRFHIMVRLRSDPNMADMQEDAYSLEDGLDLSLRTGPPGIHDDYDNEDPGEEEGEGDGEMGEEEGMGEVEEEEAGEVEEEEYDHMVVPYRDPAGYESSVADYPMEDAGLEPGPGPGSVVGVGAGARYQNLPFQQDRTAARPSPTSETRRLKASRPAPGPKMADPAEYMNLPGPPQHLPEMSPLQGAPRDDPLVLHFQGAPAQSFESPERKIIVVDLEKDLECGIGITVVGGDNTGRLDLGVFVQSVTPGGPADLDGRIQPGDRIIAIHGQSLEGISHSAAVEMLRESPTPVQLMLSQSGAAVMPPGHHSRGSTPSLDETSPERHMVLPPDGGDSAIIHGGAPKRTLVQASHVPRPPSSIGSSDLELEDVLPPEALHPAHTPKGSTSGTSSGAGTGLAAAGGGSLPRTAPAARAIPHGSARESVEGAGEAGSPIATDPQDLMPGERYVVDLEKKNNSLGLNVTGGINTSVKKGGIFVKSMPAQGPAAEDGRIQIGDRVLEVNAVSLVGVTHKQAVETLRSAPHVCRMLMEKGVAPTLHSPPGETLSPPASVGPPRTISPSVGSEASGGVSPRGGHTPSGTRTPSGSRTPNDGRTPSGARTPNDGRTPSRGLSPSGGRTMSENSEPMEIRYYPFVHRGNTFTLHLTPESRVVTIDNQSDNGEDGDDDVFVTSDDADRRSVTSANSSTTKRRRDNTFVARLEKDSTGLGFSVHGGRDVHSDHQRCLTRVKTVFPSGPAARTGLLRAGDVILEINGSPTLRLTHQEALNLLRMSSPDVRLLICRPEDGVLPDIAELESVDNSTESLDSVGGAPNVTVAEVTIEASARQLADISGSGEDSAPEQDQDTKATTSSGMRAQDGGAPTMPRAAQSTFYVGGSDSEQSGSEGEEEEEGEGEGEDIRASEEEGERKTWRRISEAEPERVAPADEESEEEEEEYKPVYVRGSDHESVTSEGHGDGGAAALDHPVNKAASSVPEEPRADDGPASARSRGRTPTPVKSFLEEAGLASGEDHSSQPSPREDDESPRSIEEDQEYYVRLTKQANGLGFTVAGGHVSPGYFYVKEVLFDPAVSCGKIRPGDRLLQVNEQDMTQLTHRDAVAYLRRTPQTVDLHLYRPTAEQRAIQEKQPATEADQKKSVRDMISAMETGAKKEVITPYKYDRKQNSLKEANTHHAEKADAVSHGEAEDDGDQSADDGDTTRSFKSRTSSFGSVTLPMPDEEQTTGGETPKVTQDGRTTPLSSRDGRMTPLSAYDGRVTPLGERGTQEVELSKSEGGSYGFSLVQREQGQLSALVVRGLTPGSPAHTDGRLQVGDKLLQVNGKNVLGIAHNKVVAIIAQSPRNIRLTVKRPSSTASSARSTPYREVEGLPSRTNNQTGIKEGLDLEEKEAAECAEDSQEKADHEEKEAAESGEDSQEEEDHEEEEDAPDGQDNPTATSPAPEKPPRKNPLRRLPSDVSDAWLESLALVRPPADTLHYAPRQLHATVKLLRKRLEEQDPIQEYKHLRHAKLTDNCLEARKSENKAKNRYRNVLPYDANRVRLSGDDDYINASHVRCMLGRETTHYIASQGPLPDTVPDFWRMIWDHRVEVIAMVTRDVEDNKVKCHRYWPESAAAPLSVAGRFTVSLIRVHRLQDFDVHYLKMEDGPTGRVHHVTHLHLTTWPDSGTPETGIPLLRYIRFMHLVHTTGPILVHCSAGIGRTGAFITVDLIMNMIAKDLKFDIQKIVQDLRRQRQGMIQTKGQYNFCYKTVLEALETLEDSHDGS